MRVQVRVAEIFSGIPDKYLPWATYQLPLGSRPGNGGIIPVQVGDIVWGRFDAGDSRQPIIVAAASSMPGGKPNLPMTSGKGLIPTSTSARKVSPLRIRRDTPKMSSSNSTMA